MGTNYRKSRVHEDCMKLIFILELQLILSEAELFICALPFLLTPVSRDKQIYHEAMLKFTCLLLDGYPAALHRPLQVQMFCVCLFPLWLGTIQALSIPGTYTSGRSTILPLALKGFLNYVGEKED